MPPKTAAQAEHTKIRPAFYAFGKLDKKGQISDKKGAASLSKASVLAGGILQRLIPARRARLRYGKDLKLRWEKSALEIQRVWRAHGKRGIVRWERGTIDIDIVVQRQTPGHVKRARDLQRVWRGHLQRKRVAFGDTPKWHAAASKLQRLYRGSVTRQLARQLKYVRSVPAAFMLVGLALLGDSGVLRRGGAGKCQTPIIVPGKQKLGGSETRSRPPTMLPQRPGTQRSGTQRPGTQRPGTQRPETQFMVPSTAKSTENLPARQSTVKVTEEAETPGQRLEREVVRAMELSQVFLLLTPDQLDLVFNCMDATNQGHIRREEVVKAARSAQLSELCVDMFFAVADVNEDEVVDRNEFDKALRFVKFFFAGSLLDKDQVTDEGLLAKIEFLKKRLVQYHAEVEVLIQNLSKLKKTERVDAIFALSQQDRIRVARANRGILQEATVFMKTQQERMLRDELSRMGDEPDEARDMKEQIEKMDLEIAYNKYFLLRSPCRQRQLSRAELAKAEAERQAAEEAARQQLLKAQEAAAAEAARLSALAAAPVILEITVLRAKNLMAADRGGTSDPYVSIQIGQGKKSAKKTSVKKKSLDPEWTETFKIRLDAAQRKHTLTLECFDYDLVGSHDSLGKVEIPLNSLALGEQYLQWHTLRQKEGIDGKGKLELRYRLIVIDHDQAPAILHVRVVRAKDLLAADRGGTSDPYVQLHVGEEIKDAKKTKIKKKTLSPEWNQDFKFRLDASQRQEDLMIECFDYDFLGADDSLGKLAISIDTLRCNEEYLEWHKLQQDDGSVGEILLGYKLVERSKEQAQGEVEILRPGTLTITVVRGKDLLAADRGGTSDPYVTMYIGDAVKEAKKTKVKKKTLTPEWNETFEFELDRSQRQDYLTVECFDHDMIGADDSLGFFDIALDSLVFEQECVEWYKLQQEGESEHRGQIELRYTFILSPPEDACNIPLAATEFNPVLLEESKPVSSSSIKLQQASKKITTALKLGSIGSATLDAVRLEVTVVRAKNVLAADRGGTSDPYVRLHLGDKIKQAQKTKVIKKTLNPVWNETFEFLVNVSRRRENLTIECFDYDIVGSNDSLGKVVIAVDQLVPEQEHMQWCNLGKDDTNKGQILLRCKVHQLYDASSSVSVLPEVAAAAAAEAQVAQQKQEEEDAAATAAGAAQAGTVSEAENLEDARERMILTSCSLFRLVRHPLALPRTEYTSDRLKMIEDSCSTALCEIRVSLREGDKYFACAHELLGRGHFQDAIAQLQRAQLCYEYADGIEREANIFFDMKSNTVLFDEGTEDKMAKILQIEEFRVDIDTMFKDSMRGVWPLHKASSQGLIGTIKYLIDKMGERVDAVDRAGKTALHVAVENKQLDTTRILIEEFGADAARRTFAGRTAIHIASDQGDEEMVRGLYESCAYRITNEVKNCLRPNLKQDQIAQEALKELGTWIESDHANTALSLAVHKLHTDVLRVFAQVQGLEEEKVTSEKGRLVDIPQMQREDTLDFDRAVSEYSMVSSVVDEDDLAKANADLLHTLNMHDKFNSQQMAPFPPGLHKTRSLSLEKDLWLDFKMRDSNHLSQTQLWNRPVSASSGSSGSRPSTAGSNSSTRSAKNLAMLRGEFRLTLIVEEARDLSARKQNFAPSACVDVSWLPAAQHGKTPEEVKERTRIKRGTTTPRWDQNFEFDVDPDGPEGWSMLTLIMWDVHKEGGIEEFLGTVTVDLADLCFGMTEGWYDLQENVDLRGAQRCVRNRLRLGQIYPMRPIQGAIYLKMDANNPVAHLPRAPPQHPMDIFADEVMLEVMQENKGASSRRRKMIIKDMWDEMLNQNPHAIHPYKDTLATLQTNHIERMNAELFVQVFDGQVIGVNYCIKEGADPNIKNEKSHTPLVIAAHRGHVKVVEALIQFKGDIHWRSNDGSTPLNQAAANGQAAVVQVLVAAKADIEARANNKSTPLISAACNGKDDAVRTLLELGADANASNAMGASPLHLAVFASHAECVKILLEKGADPKLTIKKGALAGTIPSELAKTDEVRRLLAPYESKSALFGMFKSSAAPPVTQVAQAKAQANQAYSILWVRQDDKFVAAKEFTTDARKEALFKVRGDTKTFSSESMRFSFAATGDGPIATSARTGKETVVTDFNKMVRRDLAREFGISKIHLVPLPDGSVVEYGTPSKEDVPLSELVKLSAMAMDAASLSWHGRAQASVKLTTSVVKSRLNRNKS